MNKDTTQETCIIKFCHDSNYGTRTSIKIFCPNDGGPSRTGARLATFLRKREQESERNDVVCATPLSDCDHVSGIAQDYLFASQCSSADTADKPFILDDRQVAPDRHIIDLFYKITILQDGTIRRMEVKANRVDKNVYETQKKIWDDDFALELAIKSMLVFGGSLREFARFVRIM